MAQVIQISERYKAVEDEPGREEMRKFSIYQQQEGMPWEEIYRVVVLRFGSANVFPVFPPRFPGGIYPTYFESSDDFEDLSKLIRACIATMEVD